LQPPETRKEHFVYKEMSQEATKICAPIHGGYIIFYIF
jgi:hypothetical protein